MENSNNTLVTVLTASLIHEVHIAKTLLASEGIESYIIEYAYLTNNDDLEEISLNYEKYNLSIVSAFRSYLE